MTFKNWIKEKPYWLNALSIGLVLDIIISISLSVIAFFEGDSFIRSFVQLILNPSFLFFILIIVFIGSIIDFSKNKKIVPLVISSILLVLSILLFVFLYYSMKRAYMLGG